jgi:hypothetical protein
VKDLKRSGSGEHTVNNRIAEDKKSYDVPDDERSSHAPRFLEVNKGRHPWSRHSHKDIKVSACESHDLRKLSGIDERVQNSFHENSETLKEDEGHERELIQGLSGPSGKSHPTDHE